MNTYEKLLQKAADENMRVCESFDLNGDSEPEERLNGLYINGNIALDKALDTTAQKTCVLAEELGHHHTSAGNIINLEDTRNAKQEHVARVWSYNKMIGLSGIIQAYKRHCFNNCEMAEYLDVTEEFLQEALEYYRQKYSPCIKMDGYYIIFEPSLAVVETSFLYDCKNINIRG